jgi:hypothetical protein
MLALVLASLLAQTGAPPVPPSPAAPQVERATPPAAPARPGHPPIPPLPPAPPSGVLRGEWPSQPSGKRITLDDTSSIDDALDAIADAAGWNVVLNTGRTGNKLLVLKLKNVAVEDALQAALHGTELVATRHGDTVVVAPAGEPAADRPVLTGFDKPTGRKFTGDFEDEDAGVALRKIAKAAGLSIVLPPTGDLENVNASFEGVPVEDALRAVLDQAGLAAERQGSMLVVTERPRGHGFQFSFRGKVPPNVDRDVERAMRDAEREMRDAEREARGGSKDRVVQGDVVLRPGERVRDVVAIRGSVTLDSGAEARDVVAILGSVTLEGGARVRRATAILGSVKAGPGAEISDEVTTIGGKLEADPSAEIGGEQTSVSIPGVSGIAGLVGPWFLWGHSPSPLWAIAQVLARFAMYFALGLLLVTLFPRRVDAVAASMVANPLKAVLMGALGTIGMPVLTVLLVVTIVGILLVPVQFLAIAAAAVMGFTALSFHIGRSLPIHVERWTWVLQLAAGTAIVVLITEIPILGFLAAFAGWLLVFGAVLRTRFGGLGPLPTTVVAPPPAPPASPA